MSRPWMPFFVADYLADTGHLTTIEHGAYMLLIMHYWANDGLPTDEKKLSRIARMSESEWRESRDTIAEFFSADWKHDRIEFELAESNAAYARRAAAGRKGGNARPKRKPSGSNASTLPELPHPQPQDLGKPKSISRVALASEFGEFYAAYPKHVGRSDAERAFERVMRKGVSARHVVLAASRFASAHASAGTEKQFIPAPAVWLNKGRYDDEDLPQASRTEPARIRQDKPYNPTYGELLDALRNQPNDDETAGYDGGASCSDAADRDFSGGPAIELRAVVRREAVGDFGKPLDGAGDFEAGAPRQAQRD